MFNQNVCNPISVMIHINITHVLYLMLLIINASGIFSLTFLRSISISRLFSLSPYVYLYRLFSLNDFIGARPQKRGLFCFRISALARI